MARDVARLVAPWVSALVPYRVEDAAGLVKLDAMENPYTFDAALRAQWLEAVGQAAINRYPDPGAHELRQRLLHSAGTPPGTAVVLGNGSDELIHLLLMAYHRPGATVMCAEPSFAVYGLAARALGIRCHGVPLRAMDFSLDSAAMCAAIDAERPSLVFLASPNNPTGNVFPLQDIREICAATRGIVVLDEAYWRFAGQSHIGEITRIDNLVVMQTFSKVGLAGIRIGMLFGHPDWLDPVERVRMPYNINVLSQITARFALDHAEFLDAQVARICAARDELFAALSAIDGVRAWPSQTNFVLFRTPQPAARMFAGLRTRGVLVKSVDGMHASVRDCLRVTVGTANENAAFIAALRHSL